MIKRALCALVLFCSVFVCAMDDHDSTMAQISSSPPSTGSSDRMETANSYSSDDSGLASHASSLVSSGEFSSMSSSDELKIQWVSDHCIKLEQSLSKLSIEDSDQTRRFELRDDLRRYNYKKNYLTKIKPDPMQRFAFKVERLFDERISQIEAGQPYVSDSATRDRIQMQENTISRLVKLVQLQCKVNNHLSQRMTQLRHELDLLRPLGQSASSPSPENPTDAEPEWTTEADMSL